MVKKNRTVEEKCERPKKWWGCTNGVRVRHFRTRKAALAWARSPREVPAGPSNGALQDLLRSHSRATLSNLIPRLPPMEQWVVRMSLLGKTQVEIAPVVGLTQPALHYRLRRAVARLAFLAQLPALNYLELRPRLGRVLSDPIDVCLVLFFLQSSCQSLVAQNLGVTQGFVRHRLERARDTIQRHRGLETCAQALDATLRNTNILRAVPRKLSHEDSPPAALSHSSLSG